MKFYFNFILVPVRTLTLVHMSTEQTVTCKNPLLYNSIAVSIVKGRVAIRPEIGPTYFSKIELHSIGKTVFSFYMCMYVVYETIIFSPIFSQFQPLFSRTDWQLYVPWNNFNIRPIEKRLKYAKNTIILNI